MKTDTLNITILGASSDLGEALAYAFSKEAESLTLTARDPEHLEALKKDLQVREAVGKIDLEQLDISSPDFQKLKAIAQKTDLLILTIGYLGDHEKALLDPEEANKIISANYAGLVNILHLFATAMEQGKNGGIIGISSVAGLRGRQSNYIYGSAKAGFTVFLDGLRHRLYRSGVHVMTVLPGFLDTKMVSHLDLPKPLTASPEKAAKLIYRGWKRQRNKIYVLPVWRWIMLLIKNIPEFLFKKTKL